MTAAPPDGLGSLPAFLALDAHAVYYGAKRGASVQLDETYFQGQLAALRALDTSTDLSPRIQALERSAATSDAMSFDFESLTAENLREASDRYRDTLAQLPEVTFLTNHVTETCFAVPEWSLTGSQLSYGARVYVFRDDDAPDPAEVVDANIDGVLADDPGRFDRYRGRLHGYPDCCIDAYLDRSGDAPAPEWRAMEPFSEYVADEDLRAHLDASASITDVVTSLFDTEDAHAFFAREFFPVPGCATAREMGRDVYDELAAAYPEGLVRDYFRLNFGFSFLMARAAITGAAQRPRPGTLGREHLYFYLPLSALLALYRSGQR